MGLSRKLKDKFQSFSLADHDRLVRMGWEDRSSFEAIKTQFNLSPNQFVQFMRSALDRKSFARWRRRVFEQGFLKNEIKRGFKVSRFKCSRQSTDGITKGWK